MSRIVIVRMGAVVALGFLLASAFTNWMFGASLGRTPREAALYGGVGVLAVAMNGCPATQRELVLVLDRYTVTNIGR